MCGRVRGYQVGITGAFGPYVNDKVNADLIIDGVLISHGNTQGHIWAYATGNRKTVKTTTNTICPCTSPEFSGVVPPFKGNDYYCDSGVDDGALSGKFYTTPLWTGEGYTPPNFCCSSSRMPWFCKTLPVPTTDYIEIQNCHNQAVSQENTALDIIELYIQ